ncbi:uncharacterized protein LOC107038071 [Diachasma alloeum]|uniref:uncharacterized protein LOC107038071 n=1 Tax=Diachasma alloeum TaxID=454923 RepID=UPI00073833B3|nr:uncharacterized protein LOC107038071 [Diachasma alloeum]XP_015112438.1 uncharacterized protein LOC107038071 [Diachasma alloeum]
MERRPKKVEDFYHHYPRSNDWAVSFTNNKQLPPEQLKQYFSKWGTIKNVRQTGTSGAGYCFVHFETEESARNCAIDMKSSFSIRLRPFLDRPPLSSRREAEDTGLDGEELDFSFKKREQKDQSRICDENKKIEDKSNDSGIREEINDSNNQQKIDGKSSKLNGQGLEPIEAAVARQKILNRPLEIKENSDYLMVSSNKTNGLTSTSREMNGISNGSTSSTSREHSEPSEKILKYSGASPTPRRQSSQGEIPELREASEVLGASASGAVVRPSDHVESVTAEEVVVANIPESCGIHLILDLFQQFEPICATNIKLIRQNFIRYCHIYFQTPFAAEAVETIYDNAEIYGKKLIVLRVESLEEAARA